MQISTDTDFKPMVTVKTIDSLETVPVKGCLCTGVSLRLSKEQLFTMIHSICTSLT